MVLLSSVTAPVSAMTPPQPTVAPVVRVSEASEIIVPRKAVVVPRVADWPTIQFMLPVNSPALPVLVISTIDALAVVSVVPITKVHVPPSVAPASRSSVPVNSADEVK
jgi:hypothetical protein